MVEVTHGIAHPAHIAVGAVGGSSGRHASNHDRIRFNPFESNASEHEDVALAAVDQKEHAGSVPAKEEEEEESGEGDGGGQVFEMRAAVSSYSALSTVTHATALQRTLKRHKAGRMGEHHGKHTDVPIVSVTSEVHPFSKSGGLALVASSYAVEFPRRNHLFVCVSPMYDDVPDANYIGSTSIWLAGSHHEVAYFHQFEEEEDGQGADYIFVAHGCYRRPGGLYHNAKLGVEYEDNLFRFALLSLAALEVPLVLRPRGLYLGEKILFIANDWQSALVPVYMAYKYRQPNPSKPKGTYADARCMYVTHNMGYQGQYPETRFPIGPFLGLPEAAHGHLRFHDCINLAKGAIIAADRVITVSPTYAEEIQTLHGGFGLDGFLRAKGDQLRLAGILNGIDDGWDPMTDPHLVCNYGVESVEQGKAECKAALQKSLGLDVEPDTLLLGFVGRLAWQKGIDLLEAAAPWLLDSRGKWPVQLIMMGHGDREYTEFLQWAEATYAGQVCGYAGFSPIVEHHMIAGCDVLLMPSRYEPCGLPQMYALQYGTLPVVHATGGLRDSVRDGETGFHFAPFEVEGFQHALYRAVETYNIDKKAWREMQIAAMTCDFYWPRAIDEYEKHIDYTFDAPPAIHVDPLPAKPLNTRLRKRAKEGSAVPLPQPAKVASQQREGPTAIKVTGAVDSQAEPRTGPVGHQDQQSTRVPPVSSNGRTG
mmetsp:Transcript_113060/g.259031  ORF Transcript_113060/g.259031 Transcript_113060/m.259031 type:complete len:706 (+) Transcript_113060:2355-4472(+)